MPHRTVIAGGLLVTDTDETRADLVIDDDVIVALLADATGVDADEHIDATDLLVLPGVIDAHAEALWLDAGASVALAAQRAAAAGGMTTLVMDAGRPVPARDAPGWLGVDMARWHPLPGGALPTPERLAQAARTGIAGFAARTGRSDDALSDAELLAAMRALADLPVPLSLAAAHPELAATEPLAELAGTMLALLFAEQTGAWVHLRNLSTAAAMQQVVEARARQVRVTASISLLHLAPGAGDDPDMEADPPLRPWDEVDLLWPYVLDESVDCITAGLSRHNGTAVPNAQLALPLFWEEAVTKRGMRRPQAVRQLATNAAQMLGLYPRKGTIRVGSDADLVLFDPEGTWTVRHADMLHEPRWSAFDGRQVTGFVVRTLRRGRTVYDAERHEDDSTLPAGSGQVLSRVAEGTQAPRPTPSHRTDTRTSGSRHLLVGDGRGGRRTSSLTAGHPAQANDRVRRPPLPLAAYVRDEGAGSASMDGRGASSGRGRVMVNVAPWPGALSAAIVPPCCATICFAIARPRPLPRVVREVSTR